WDDPFFRMPNDVIDKGNLDPYELTTLCVLRRFANGNIKKEAWPSINKISKLSNQSRNRTIKSIKSLIDKGYVIKEIRRTEKGDCSSNIYK
ncbi:helix-turn-helix domain-containing protein, partial [Enterobacter bugandensis]|uniref:helix-turn-helix domain-containing protein n=1 Tax=Enterobacter bugandensis TaxID=881260 RepID=UPI001239CA1B